MQKQGNNHSSLLDSIMKTAESSEPKKVSFDETVLEALKATEQPSLKDIIADVSKGKNIRRTAQWDSMADPMAKPMAEPPMDEGLEPGQATELVPEDTLDTNPVEPEGDTEAAKQSVAQALVDLCGSPEAACDCVNSLTGGAEGLGDELGAEEPMDEELGDEMLAAPMEEPSASMEMPSPM